MIYTVWAEYGATGEGQTYMVLFTRGYGKDKDRRVNAVENFREYFGGWYASGATVEEGLNFDFPGAKFLVSDALRKSLEEWQHEANLSYHASFHFNFS